MKQTVHHSETTARSKFQKKTKGKSVVAPSGGGETAGILKQPMGKRKRPFQIEEFIICTYIYPYLPQILKTRLADKTFSNRRYCQTTNGEAEKTISNRRYSLYVHIFTHIYQILKTRLADKTFSNRRYCQTTNGEAEKTISNRRYSLYAHIFTHISPKFSKQDWPTKHFQIEDIVKQPMGKRKRPFQIEDIHYMHIFLTICTPNSQNKIGRQSIFK